MKRSPLARKTPLRRSRMRKTAAPRRVTRPGPGRDEAYLEAVRKLPCLARSMLMASDIADLFCDGDIIPHHAGPKTNDSTAVPLCFRRHNHWHDGNGVFDDWRKPERRAWAQVAIEDTRRLVRGES